MKGNNPQAKGLFVKVKAPIQCHLWTKNKLTNEDLHFENVRTFYEDNHLERSIIRCKECGQLYYYEFYEIVDWDKGNDKMYCTYIPIEADEKLITDLNSRIPIELLAVTPQLHWNPDNKIFWSK